VFASLAVVNARLHAGVRERAAAQTLHDTMVTLSHYVNNPLQALLSAAERLKADVSDCHTMAQVVETIEEETQQIKTVISVLQDVTRPESSVYWGSVRMLRIEQELRKRLAEARRGAG
jgi:K+-sensing histidine kinase KdpD